jgi:uncharacterized protein YegP (UPF0339 family)
MPGRVFTGTFEIFKGGAEGLFCFRLRSSYGAALMESAECYASREAALRTIELIQRTVPATKIVDLTLEA